jgi:hypothetical protein
VASGMGSPNLTRTKPHSGDRGREDEHALWQSAAMRRSIPWVLLAILGLAAVGAGFLGRSSTPSAGTSKNRELVSPYYLTGLSLPLAEQIAKDAGLHLSVLRVPSRAPVGQVIGQDLNFQKDRTVVVSTGLLHNPFKILPPATVPPVHAECAGGLVLYEDGNVGPLTCRGGVNVGAWENLAGGRSPLMSLGPSPTEEQVIAAVCAGGSYTTNQLDSVYDLASAYYGWHFGERLFIDYTNGVNGTHCPSNQ